MNNKIKKLFFLVPIFIFLFSCKDNTPTPFTSGIKINLKNKPAEIFQQYVNATVFDIVICPLADNSQVKIILSHGFIENSNKAKIGDPKAQYAVGIAYIYGLGIKSNIDFGMDWIRKAAAQNYAPALSYYGLFLKKDKTYITNLSPEQIYNQSIEYIKQASEQNFLPAKYFLAHLKSIDDSEENHKKWINILESLAQQEHDQVIQSLSQAALADHYFYGIYVPQNYEKALGLYKLPLQHTPALKTMDLAMAGISLIYSSPTQFYDGKKAKIWMERTHQFDKEAFHCEKAK